MTTINGLPAHILLVHAVVVLVPIAAVLAVVAVAWPAARRRIGVVLPALSLLCLILVPITTSAGEWLEKHVDENSYVERHTSMGEDLLPWVVLLFVFALVFWGLDHATRLGDKVQGLASHRLVRPIVSVLLVVVAVVAVIEVVRIGDSGAQATWHDGFRP